MGVGSLLLGGMRAVNLGNDKEGGCALERQEGGREEFRQHNVGNGEISEVNTDRENKEKRKQGNRRAKKGQYIRQETSVKKQFKRWSQIVRSGRGWSRSVALSLAQKATSKSPRRKKKGGS